MKTSDILASIGVIILLIAFVLNLFKKMPANGFWYGFLNFLGAGINCYASWMIRFYPFVLLEAVWSIVALISLFKVPRGTSSDTE